MSNKKKFKFYTHHGQAFSVGAKSKNFWRKLPGFLLDKIFDFFYFLGRALIKISKLFAKGLWTIFYTVGGLIVWPFVRAFKFAKNDIAKTKQALPKRFKLLLENQFSRTLLLFLAVALVAYGGIGFLRLVAKGLELKTQVAQTAFLGNAYLSKAKDELSNQDLTGAQDSFTRAYQTFSQGQSQISQSGQVLNSLLGLLPQKQAADGLLQAASLVSSAGQDFITLESQFKQLSVGPAGLNSADGNAPQDLQNAGASLNSALDKISRASALLSAIDPSTLPQANRETFVTLRGQLQAGQLALSNFSAVFNLFSALFSGQKTILAVFENNDELRAGGGFIGTYGDIRLNNGAVVKMTVSSIYDLDGQLTEIIKPPEPILNLSDRWYMRDSNWFASFPDSAKKISDFYELEGGETPDVVIALTPNLIIDLLKLTGPITLPKYKVTLTADNFVEETEAITTISDPLPTNSPKQILADLVPVLLQKLAGSGKTQWPQIIQALQTELTNKQIVVYSRDPNLENQFENFRWDGSLQNNDRDYLSVVSSNLGGTKTDLEVTQKINLTTTVNQDGSITNEVDITRTNQLPDLPQTDNDSYIRVYAPLGSKLVSNIGFDYKNLAYPDGEQYTIDDDVYAWEKNSVTDNLTGTTIGEESGKTFFGNWLDIKGGESKTVKLVYQLPFKLSDVDRYSLLLQKQIGAANADFNWTLNFAGRQVAWKNFDTQTLNTDNLNTDILLDKDYFFGLVLAK